MASPGGSRMSNLQVLAKRCPVMGKALAVQSARTGNTALAGAFGGVRAYHAKVGDRAKFHSGTSKEARVETVREKHCKAHKVNCEDYKTK